MTSEPTASPPSDTRDQTLGQGAAAEAPAAGERPTAVVADDSGPARDLLADALAFYAGFDVVGAAADGREAVQAVAEHRPDLAVLDLAMPVAGALDVIGDINLISPATRVVVVSAFPGAGLERTVLDRGAAGFVRKGPSIRRVVERITTAAAVLEVAGQVLAATRQFDLDLTAPRAARRFVGEVLAGTDVAAEMDLVELLLAELVTNAVVHARSEPEVTVRLSEETLRVEVSDDSDRIPQPKPPDPEAFGGRGLAMVEAMASAWGVSPRPAGGKTVWFELPAPGVGVA